jgi:hypothetical protein
MPDIEPRVSVVMVFVVPLGCMRLEECSGARHCIGKGPEAGGST